MIFSDVIKVFVPGIVAFIIGVLATPALTRFLYTYKMWKKKSGKIDMEGKETVLFNSLHKEREVNTPRMGGIIIWASTAITILLFFLLSKILPYDIFIKLDFLSRSQTWIPLFTIVCGGLVGLIDDYLEIRGGGGHNAGGLSLRKRLFVVGMLSLFCACWFYFKLDVTGIGLPFNGFLSLGIFFIPFFVAITLLLYSGGVIDGIDGLAGGIFATIFAAYAGIAFYQTQINLAAFCAVVSGAILAFLWFNVAPARYYMSETGSMALTITLAIVAFMTDSLGEGYGILVLPIIGFPLLITTTSVVIQVLSKKFRGKKVFLIAPLHHHFEAIGWPSYKVTMRYWIIGIVCAIVGLVFSLIG